MLKRMVQLLFMLCTLYYSWRNHLLPLGIAWIFESNFSVVNNYLHPHFIYYVHSKDHIEWTFYFIYFLWMSLCTTKQWIYYKKHQEVTKGNHNKLEFFQTEKNWVCLLEKIISKVFILWLMYAFELLLWQDSLAKFHFGSEGSIMLITTSCWGRWREKSVTGIEGRDTKW